MTKPLPHRPGKGHGRRRAPASNAYRVAGEVAFIDVGTKTHPGKEAMVDLSDLPLVLDGKGKWYARTANGETFYVSRCLYIGGKKVVAQLHRHLAGLPLGGRSTVPDHKDRDGLNNRRDNLRIATRPHNGANRRSTKGREFKGVFARKSKRPGGATKYRAVIGVNLKLIGLGTFSSQEDAARAYDDAARKYFGEFALTNFPPTEASHA